VNCSTLGYTYKNFTGKPRKGKALGRPGGRWQNNKILQKYYVEVWLELNSLRTGLNGEVLCTW